MLDPLHLSAPIASAIALSLLWIGEALWPLIERRRSPDNLRARGRHLVLGLLNALTAALFAGLTLIVTAWADSHQVGLVRLLDRLIPSSVVANIGLFALALILLDAWHYSFHVVAHKTPILWRFHAVHHNDPHVEATTAMRFHMGEIAVQCLASLPVYVILGVGITHILVYQVILLPMALFHHANIDLSPRVDRVLRWFIVTPRMHIVHHSKWEPETDSNYSAVLSVWDRVFGSYRWREDPRRIDLGLTGYSEQEIDTLMGILLTPLEPAKAGFGPEPDESLLPAQHRRLP